MTDEEWKRAASVVAKAGDWAYIVTLDGKPYEVWLDKEAAENAAVSYMKECRAIYDSQVARGLKPYYPLKKAKVWCSMIVPYKVTEQSGGQGA